MRGDRRKWTDYERKALRRAADRARFETRPRETDGPEEPGAVMPDPSPDSDLPWYPTSVHLRAPDFEALHILKERYGLVSPGDAIRFAIRVVAAMDPLVLQSQLALLMQAGPDGEGIRLLMTVPQRGSNRPGTDRKEVE